MVAPKGRRKMVYASRQSRQETLRQRLARRGFVVRIKMIVDGERYSIRGNGVCRNNMETYDVLKFLDEWDQEHE